MSNAPVIKEVIKPVKKAVAGKPPVQETATVRKKAVTKARDVAEDRREAVAAAAERSAAARARRGGRGLRSLLSRARGGLRDNQLPRTLGGLE